jgi:putative tryptophan/tyrosine transport system substrate-binding protein
MKRRKFVSLLGGAVVSWPFVARAQQTPIRIGFLPLGLASNLYDQSLVEAFRKGLRQVGLIENRDVVLDVAWITGDPDAAVARLIQRGAALLISCGTSASLAAKRRAPSLPVIFISVGNPIGIGLVESLARPGGNATGFSDALAEVGGKLVETAIELGLPQGPIDYLWHNAWADGQFRLKATEQVAQSLGVKLRARGIADISEADDVIAAIKKDGSNTMIVQPSPFTYQERTRLIDSANKYGLGAIFAFPAAAREGALIAYGPDYVHLYQRAPLYVERVLKGTRPADLPVEEPAKFELIVNLKVAKQLKLEVPLSLLIRADELIE